MSAAAVAAFEKVDREWVHSARGLWFTTDGLHYILASRYVVNAAKAAQIHDASIPQRLIYISVRVNVVSSSCFSFAM